MLKRDIVVTFSSNVFSTMLSLGSFVILSRVLQPEGRGLLGLALLIPHTVAMFCNLGQGTVNSTYAGLYKEKRTQLFQQSLLIALFTVATSGLILFAFFFWLPIPRGEFDKLDAAMVYLICFYAPMVTFNMIILSLVRGVGHITTAAKIRAIQSIFHVALLAFFLLWLRRGVKTVIIILMAEQVFAILISLWSLRNYISLDWRHFSGRFLQKSLIFGIQFSMANLASFLIFRLDQGILAYMVSKYHIGLYVVAVALAEKLKILPTSISQAFLPRLANELDTRQSQVSKVFRCTNIISFASMLLVGLMGIPIIYIFCGKNFAGSIPSFLLLLPGIVVIGGSGILSSDLAARNKPKYTLIMGWVILVINVLFNLALIPLIGIAGAALASTLSYIMAHGMVIYFYHKESKVPLSEMVPTTEDCRYLWQQGMVLLRHVPKRFRKR